MRGGIEAGSFSELGIAARRPLLHGNRSLEAAPAWDSLGRKSEGSGI